MMMMVMTMNVRHFVVEMIYKHTLSLLLLPPLTTQTPPPLSGPV